MIIYFIQQTSNREADRSASVVDGVEGSGFHGGEYLLGRVLGKAFWKGLALHGRMHSTHRFCSAVGQVL